ncbi:FAD/NAD(P)-binding protein [Acidicapsa dinghuensis]|uniref:FAD/NAD(P)-binding protein n=1 Tax=Acidicapsa dinghuensis TaxID=2218256 RepID=A0ABW1EKI8_9BACT|nr:FAD/NAD(P)-binding protein [Acidicapsa dinghuensis]
MTTRNGKIATIAIIGGGVSGTLTAFHLIRQRTPARVILIDQRPDFGLGLAYSTPSFRHLLNVPAGKISALPDQPNHFLNWLRRNHDPAATEKTFAPRAIFGQYIQSLLKSTSELEQEIATVVDVRQHDAGAVLTLDNGCELRADLVVLATGNFDPAPLPGISKVASDLGLYRHNAWAEETYEGLDPDAPVALIGTGLTGVDVVLRLRELGHRGKIIAVSRHGVFPNRHADYTPLSSSAIPQDTPATCVAYLRALRAVIGGGTEWRAAIDSLRDTINDLWLRLPIEEKKRFRRHLQRRWDVVRHRMAPPIADVIESELRSGTLEIREGRLKTVDASPAGARIVFRTHAGDESFHADRVINCTGPSMNYRRVPSALLQNMFSRGLVTAGPLGTGFHCSPNGAVIGADGHASEIIFNLGPGRLGDLIESIAVPEIRQQAVELASTLADRVRSQYMIPEATVMESAPKLVAA